MSPKTFYHMFKVALAEWAAIMVLLDWFAARCRLAQSRRGLNAAFALLALLAVPAYFDCFNFYKYGQYMNPHDMFHYYLGAKYSPEIGAFDLYNCALIADQEGGRAYKGSYIRDLRDHSMTSTRAVLADKSKYKALFTQARWESFAQDVAFYFEHLDPKQRQRVLVDKGYNATPVWNLTGRILTNLCPTSSPMAMGFLLAMDLLLLLAMLLLVAWAFGWQTACLVLAFCGVNFAMSFTHGRMALLRFDWFCLAAMAVCLVKKGWYKTAGACLAYAVCTRIFPLAFAVGLGGKFLWDLLEQRTVNRRIFAFFLTMGVVVAVLVGASIAADGGLSRWQTFFEKISVHNKDISVQRVGFKYLFLAGAANKAAVFESRRALWWAIQAAMLAVTLLLTRRLDDDECIAFSYVPVFFLFAPTFYYHVMLIVPLLFFITRRENFWRALGGAYLFLMMAGPFIYHRAKPGFLDTDVFLIFTWLIFAAVVYMTLLAGAAFIKRPVPAPTGAAAE